MGYYTFRWPRQAQEVIVTGSFDGWSKSIRLDRQDDDGFAKELLLPETDERILYKFVVDGNWRTDPAALQEEIDDHNNINSVLLPERISPTSSTAKMTNGDTTNKDTLQTATLSGVTPESTTAGLAGAVPKEPDAHQATISSAAPISSTADLAKDVPLETTPGTFPESPINEGEFSVRPLPGSSSLGNPVHLAPGEKLPDSAKNGTPKGMNSNVTTDKESYEQDASDPISVSPLPATGTVGNPSGEKVSDSTNNVTSKDLGSNVTTDKESYEKDASDPAMAAMAAAAAAGGSEEKKKQVDSGDDQQQFSVNPLPATGTVGNPVKVAPGEQLPKSGDVTSNTIGSNVTTDKESYEKDASDPAMAAMAAAAAGGSEEKKQVESPEDQQQFSVSPLPATGTVGNPSSSDKVTPNTLGSNVTTDKESYEKDASDPAMAAMAAEQHKHDQKNTYSALPIGTEPKAKSVGPNDNPAISSAAPVATTAALAGTVPLERPAGSSFMTTAAGQKYDPEVPAKEVPDIVKESMHKAHTDPEAACIPEMVKEKEDLERELLKEVPQATGSGQPAPTTSATTASTAPAPTTTDPVSKQDTLHPGTGAGAGTGDISPKSHTPDVPAGGSNNDGPITKGTTASQVPDAPKETPQVTTGPVTTNVPTTSGVPERKAVEPQTTATATAGASKGDSSVQNGTAAHTEEHDRKKKHRLSGFLYKLKEKFT
ncbi:hypothetical protein MGYG_00628 [Nannizzia gypsea CBS 118893]|uniref:AMP-activated protein kinase glycogen-binding domain-containing protein n=1 Tax=Arthroderma gypseum (strain ATCC MYA-4604 / CBS 118893) TaxID=535722 RepID=E5R0T2_ARTGP|nr:hypothetical protein MGYG_00628 [Nannizzia gypsea CBS 118893]EFQ97588.1 hypothetical protein MGYG_00628 [Nannizzia gypsea CBS 118893]